MRKLLVTGAGTSLSGFSYARAAKYDYVCTIHAGMVGTITVVR